MALSDEDIKSRSAALSGLFTNFDHSAVHLELIVFSDFSNYNNRGNRAVSNTNH